MLINKKLQFLNYAKVSSRWGLQSDDWVAAWPVLIGEALRFSDQ